MFGWLKENAGNNWVDAFLKLASGLEFPRKAGLLQCIHLDPELKVPASSVRLEWMIRNTKLLAPTDGKRWQEYEKRLSNSKLTEAALLQLSLGNTKGVNKKLIFEGKTNADCVLECEHSIIWVEGKRFDWLTPSTTWDVHRDQLARNVEAAWILTKKKNKDFCVIICHEHALKHHERNLVEGYRNCTWAGGWPHVLSSQRRDFSKRIGTLTWQKIADYWPKMRSLPELQDLAKS